MCCVSSQDDYFKSWAPAKSPDQGESFQMEFCPCHPPFKENVRIVPVLGTISHLLSRLEPWVCTQQREEVGFLVCVADVRSSYMSSVLFLLSLVCSGSSWFMLGWKITVPHQVLACSVIHFVEANRWIHFYLHASALKKSLHKCGFSLWAIILLPPHSSPAYYPLWLVELADPTQVVLTHLLAPLRPLQSLSALHSAKAKLGFFSRTLTSHFLSCQLLWCTSAPLKSKGEFSAPCHMQGDMVVRWSAHPALCGKIPALQMLSSSFACCLVRFCCVFLSIVMLFDHESELMLHLKINLKKPCTVWVGWLNCIALNREFKSPSRASSVLCQLSFADLAQ